MRTTIVITTLILMLISSIALADVPQMINYQGKLLQPSGAPVADGTYTMTFAIYNVATGGTALWTETNPSVQVKGGLFAAMLGSITPISLTVFNTPTLFFGMNVGSDPEMTPRQQMTSSPFAFRASIAGTVDDGAITTSMFANGAVGNSQIAAGAVATSNIADATVTMGKMGDTVNSPSLIQTWRDDSDHSIANACCWGQASMTVDPSISVTVPSGMVQYYLVTYQADLGYVQSQAKNGQSSFYAYWTAQLMSGTTALSPLTYAADTGYRFDWGSVGNSYWNFPFTITWVVQLGAGTTNLTVLFSGYSDNTMNTAHLSLQRMQVMRTH